MLVSMILMAVITIGGLFTTYLVSRDRTLMWRAAAGCVIGSGIYGVGLFVLGSLFGGGMAASIVAAVIAAAPAALLYNKDVKKKFDRELDSAKGKFQQTNGRKVASAAYFVGFFLLFYLFFDRTYLDINGAIHTGGSQNYGDLPYHIGAITSFTEGNNFPPQNPSYAGAKFTYPFVSDLISAGFVMVGSSIRASLLVPNIAWAFSLLALLATFFTDLTGSRRAGRIGAALLFLSGGLGFAWFLNDYWQSGRGFFEFVNKLTRDYTINDTFRWGNSMVVLFMTQRSLLLGMPITVIVLGWLWRVFTASDEELDSASTVGWKFPHVPLLVGGLAGLLPLIHLHSLAVLFVVTGVLLFARFDRVKWWLAFGAGVCITALPELIWLMTGTATDAVKFFEWKFGWDKRSDGFVWFWFKNTGLVFPLLAAGIAIAILKLRSLRSGEPDETAAAESTRLTRLLIFYIPFALFFIICNVAKLAPWEWDNIKVLIYWYVGSIPFMVLAVEKLLDAGKAGFAVGVLAVVVLVAAGSLDVWRTVTGNVDMRIFEPEAVRIADQIKKRTDPKAVIVNAPTFKSAVVLSGRQSLMRYSGHLNSHGINYVERESDVKQIYQSAAVSESLLKKYNVDYVLVSPDELTTMNVNQANFAKYPVVAEAGQFKLYKVK